MTSQPKRSGDDYLKSLFDQSGSVSFGEKIPDFLSATDTAHPALSGASLRDVLTQMDLEFLVPYVEQGDTDRMIPEDREIGDDLLFFEYRCPDTDALANTPVDSVAGEGGDDDLEDDNLLQERLKVDLVVPNHFAAGVNIVFNEDTSCYQLDFAFLQMEGGDAADLDCGKNNEGQIKNFLAVFSSLAERVSSKEPMTLADVRLMSGFYKKPDAAPGREP